MDKSIKLLLADDHRILISGIRSIIELYAGFEIIGECEDGEQVVEFLKKDKPDVILMDIDMPNKNGIETTEYIVENFPGIKILALSMHHDQVTIGKMLKAGASGYILKNTEKDVLINAIKRVYDGEKVYSDEVVKTIMEGFNSKGSAKRKSSYILSVEDLTKREKEILKLIVQEKTNKDISEMLFISPRTVDTHRRNLLDKLQVKNTAGLVRFAFENGLMD